MPAKTGLLSHHVRNKTILLLYAALVLLIMVPLIASCGNPQSEDATDNDREEIMRESLQGFENQLDFELTEPLYSMLTAEVLKVEQAQPYNLVLVEVKNSEYPAGLESNPYADQDIGQGTLLVIEWNNETRPEEGSIFMIPAEFVKAVNGIRITIKGTPREAQGVGQE